MTSNDILSRHALPWAKELVDAFPVVVIEGVPLTESADLLRLERTPDSLAGRAVKLPSGTLSQGEINGRLDDFVTRLLAGVDPFDVRSSVSREDYANLLAAVGVSGGLSAVAATAGGLVRRIRGPHR
ncbi:hypothetical protein [Nocardia sp. NPDC058705]|uniref:hypothetical protein n=1 Tax=Nocardia sp. NPDC058705 TaxID=3346609 RepID=UPI0036742FA7